MPEQSDFWQTVLKHPDRVDLAVCVAEHLGIGSDLHKLTEQQRAEVLLIMTEGHDSQGRHVWFFSKVSDEWGNHA